MGNSFIDDQEKMIDFFLISRDEFLRFYPYLTKEDYDATVRDVIDKSEYWHSRWYDENPNMDGRALRDIALGIMLVNWLTGGK